MGSGSSRKTSDKRTQIPSATMRVESKLTTLGTMQHTDPLTAVVIPTQTIDVRPLDQIVEEVDFSDIIDANITFQIDAASSSSKTASISTKLLQKQSQNHHWEEKYFVHGNSSDIVADVESQTHGCVTSSVSEDVDLYISNLHTINIMVDKYIQDRIAQVSTMEQTIIHRLIQERQVIINQLLSNGNSYMNQYEDYYRRLLEEFISKLEIEMSIHLDELQKQMDNDQDIVFVCSQENIKDINIKAQHAKSDILERIHYQANQKRDELLQKIAVLSTNKIRQPLGFEQLRTLKLQIYSTVGIKQDGQGCDNIPERERFIKDIDAAKPHQSIKRTVYLGSNMNSKLLNRKTGS